MATKKISELDIGLFADLEDASIIAVTTFDGAGNPIATKRFTVGEINRVGISQLTVDQQNLPSETLEFLGPKFGLTTDGKLAFMSESGENFEPVLVGENNEFQVTLKLEEIGNTIPEQNEVGANNGRISIGDGSTVGGKKTAFIEDLNFTENARLDGDSDFGNIVYETVRGAFNQESVLGESFKTSAGYATFTFWDGTKEVAGDGVAANSIGGSDVVKRIPSGLEAWGNKSQKRISVHPSNSAGEESGFFTSFVEDEDVVKSSFFGNTGLQNISLQSNSRTVADLTSLTSLESLAIVGGGNVNFVDISNLPNLTTVDIRRVGLNGNGAEINFYNLFSSVSSNADLRFDIVSSNLQENLNLDFSLSTGGHQINIESNSGLKFLNLSEMSSIVDSGENPTSVATTYDVRFNHDLTGVVLPSFDTFEIKTIDENPNLSGIVSNGFRARYGPDFGGIGSSINLKDNNLSLDAVFEFISGMGSPYYFDAGDGSIQDATSLLPTLKEAFTVRLQGNPCFSGEDGNGIAVLTGGVNHTYADILALTGSKMIEIVGN